MNLEKQVLEELTARPATGGGLIERLLLGSPGPARGRAVLVYAALSQLRARGLAEPLVETPQAIVWGPAGRPAPPPPSTRAPASFVLPEGERERLEDALRRTTRGLPLWTFEELRRAVLAVAERRAFEGAKPRRALDSALADLGPPHGVRTVLRKFAAGRTVALRLPGRGLRVVVKPLLVLAALAIFFGLVLRPYTLPPESISMAPTLVPAADGGDGLVLVDRTAFLRGDPRRGDVVVFRGPGGSGTWVKRVLGLPGESIALHQGDLFVDGERFVQSRALLDRVAVPLFGLDGFERTADPPGWRQTAPIDDGFVWPDGHREEGRRGATDVVIRLKIRLGGRPSGMTVLLEEQGGARMSVHLNDAGYGAGASVEGREVAQGTDFRLEPGVAVELWMTNADRVFRVELDGKEVARAPIRAHGSQPTVTLVEDGKPSAIDELEVSRDLVHGEVTGVPRMEWPLGDDQYFLLGDNSGSSLDSRSAGPIAGGELLGRVVVVVWPPGRVRVVR